jgi:hypothetical protein
MVCATPGWQAQRLLLAKKPINRGHLVGISDGLAYKHFQRVRDKKRQLLIRTKYASEMMIQCHFQKPNTHTHTHFVSGGEAFRSSSDDDIFCQIRTTSL